MNLSVFPYPLTVFFFFQRKWWQHFHTSAEVLKSPTECGNAAKQASVKDVKLWGKERNKEHTKHDCLALIFFNFVFLFKYFVKQGPLINKNYVIKKIKLPSYCACDCWGRMRGLVKVTQYPQRVTFPKMKAKSRNVPKSFYKKKFFSIKVNITVRCHNPRQEMTTRRTAAWHVYKSSNVENSQSFFTRIPCL